MKKIYSFLFPLFTVLTVSAQTPEKCGIMKNYNENCQKNPAYAAQIQAAELKARQWQQQHKNTSNAKMNNTVVIPVVFHCMYSSTTSPTYLHDSIFARQMAILNETYSRLNPNYVNTRPIFDSLGVNTDIQFCFASVDPQGNPTNGINRVQSSTNFLMAPLNDNVKDPSQGGAAPWDAAHYLNIWTCDMSFNGTPFVLGYATFPGGDPSKDGVVLQFEYVGYQNTGNSNNLGRTAVHEVGHWLGMRHIWGDGQNGNAPCDSIDYVDDTPHADGPSQQTCDTSKNTCSTEHNFWAQFGIDPPDMIENYMDYSTDGCMTMFTKGQKDRMWSFLNTARVDLLSNPVACYTSVDETDLFAEHIYLYPSPVKDILNLNFASVDIGGTTVEFYNVSGQVVKMLKVEAMQNKINVAELSSGLYFLKISKPGHMVVKKLVVE